MNLMEKFIIRKSNQQYLGVYKMENKDKKFTKKLAPQLKVRSNVSAGGSVEACMKNLKYWKDAYDARCLLQ
jgi:hypothetical protein